VVGELTVAPVLDDILSLSLAVAVDPLLDDENGFDACDGGIKHRSI
jgi:hypothetical protein